MSSVISELAEFLKDMLFRESDLSVKNSRSIISYDESIEIVRVSCGLLHATSSGWAMIFVLKACLDLIERVPNLEPKLDLLCIECFQEIFSDDTIPQKLASDWNHFVNQCEKDKEGSCFTLMSLCWELVVFQVQHSESSLVEVQGFWECRYFNVLTTDDFSLSCLLLWIRSLCESFTASQEIWNKLLSSQSYLAYGNPSYIYCF